MVLHLEHIWESEKLEVGKNFNNIVRKLIKRREEEEWRDQMEKKPKLRLYRKLKSRLVLENYVLDIERENRRYLTMLRGGTNYLRIERGRWVGESEGERVCNVCLCNEVEDEKHFLLTCPMYVSERVEMFRRIREDCELEHAEDMNEDWQMNILIGIGWRKSEYIRKAFEIKKRYT